MNERSGPVWWNEVCVCVCVWDRHVLDTNSFLSETAESIISNVTLTSCDIHPGTKFGLNGVTFLFGLLGVSECSRGSTYCFCNWSMRILCESTWRTIHSSSFKTWNVLPQRIQTPFSLSSSEPAPGAENCRPKHYGKSRWRTWNSVIQLSNWDSSIFFCWMIWVSSRPS